MTDYRSKKMERLVAAVGLLAGLALAAKTFSGTMLLNWDQVIGPTIPVPPGQYGSGLELPRRVPFYTILASASRVVPGPAVVGLLLVASVTSAVLGAFRLFGAAGREVLAPVAGSLALVYGISPFLLTRAAVGHLPLVAAAAMLPWLLLSLRSRPWPGALGWAALFALTGSSGAVLGLLPIALYVVLDRSSGVSWLTKAGRLLAVVVAQSIWVVPGLVAVSRGIPLPETDVGAFATRVENVGDALALAVGGGFFIGSEDLAARNSIPAALLGMMVLLLLGIAIVDTRRHLDLAVGDRALLWAGLIGGVAVVSSAIPGLDALVEVVAQGPLGVARETQKFWPLPFLAIGVFVTRSSAVWPEHRLHLTFGPPMLIAAMAVMTAWPGLWGAGGRLDAHDPPESWNTIEGALAADPGPIVVFPWRRYDRLDLSQGRNVLQPAPWLLGEQDPMHVWVSGNPGLDPAAQERGEALEDELAALDVEVRGGRAIGPQLQALGVRWVLVSGSPEADFYRRLANEPEIEVHVDVDGYLLYEVVPTQPATASNTRSDGLPGSAIALFGIAPTVGALWWSRRRP